MPFVENSSLLPRFKENMTWNIPSMSYKLNKKHSTRVKVQNSTSSPIWCKAYTELIHAPSSNTSTSAKLLLTSNLGLPSFTNTSQNSWKAQKRGKRSGRSPRTCKESDLDLLSCCQPQELLPERNGSEMNGSPVPNQHEISRLQAAASLDETFREACHHVRCRSLSRHFLRSSRGWSCDFVTMCKEMFDLLACKTASRGKCQLR